MSSADSATVENSSGVNASVSLYSAEIEYNYGDTITKSIVDVSDSSTMTKWADILLYYATIFDLKYLFLKLV